MIEITGSKYMAEDPDSRFVELIFKMIIIHSENQGPDLKAAGFDRVFKIKKTRISDQ